MPRLNLSTIYIALYEGLERLSAIVPTTYVVGYCYAARFTG